MDAQPEVVVHLGDGSHTPSPIDPARPGTVAADPSADHPFLVLTRTPTDRIQARYLDDGTYELEHTTDTDHRQLFTTDARLVRDILWSWIQRDTWWSDTVAWTTIDPAIVELHALHTELSDMLAGISLMDSATDELDQALSRADELLSDFDLDFGE
ncbi:hypothetical protein ACFWU5_10170 [Nocardia sp. NPDC058640]|uniref:hypothetical protein n=1 Tax=Nocardia sp. NPDC058640 TaxID=3346571 RepID=UPI0036642331